MAEGKTTALTIRDYMAAPAVQQRIKEMFTDKRLMDNFVQSVISIAGSDELLAVAEPRSVFNACLTAASMNLPINKNLGFAHIIGYNNSKKGVTEAQFQMGARGFKELAQRTGQYMVINQGDVREGELKGRDRLTGELNLEWIEDDAIREQLPVVGYFSYFKLKNGFSSTLYMSMDEIKAHGLRYSQSYKRGYGPWKDNFDAMALKTVSKLNISKNGPLSIELQKAVNYDQAVIRDEGEPEYIDGELSDVGASDDKQDAIVAANQPAEQPAAEAPAKAKPAAKAKQPAKAAVAADEPAPAKPSVKDKLANSDWPKGEGGQGKLLDEDPKSDKGTRSNPGQ